jgi:hypothetical protein
MSTSGQDRLRQQWQIQERTGRSAKLWLILRRTVATLLALGLVVAFGFGLYSYLNAAKSYLAYYSANIYDPTSGAPIAFAAGDFEKIASLENAFAKTDLDDPVKEPLTKPRLEEKLRGLATMASGPKDTLIVFLTAHGRVEDGNAALLCEASEGGGALPLSDVLEKIKASSAGTKLLILDAGRDTAGPVDAGLDQFSDRVGSAVKQQNDSKLWVFCANSAYEHSHVSPKLQQSLFSYAIFKGLSGEADMEGHGDEDGEIDLYELYSFVRNNVSAWVRDDESRTDTQTPQLIHLSSAEVDPDELKKHHLTVVKALSSKNESEGATEGQNEGAVGGFIARAAESGKELVRLDEINVTLKKFGIGSGKGNEAPNQDEAGKPKPTNGSQTADSSGESTSSTTGSEPKVDKAVATSDRVAKAWERIAEIEGRPPHLRPEKVNSPEWNEIQRWLVWCELVTRSGLPNDAHKPWRTFDTIIGGIENALSAVSSQGRPRQLASKVRVSLALMEHGDASEGLRKFIGDYDELLQHNASSAGTESSVALKQRLIELLRSTASADAPPESKERAAAAEELHLDQYYELWLARELCATPEVDWETLRLMLLSRRLSEQVALSQLADDEKWQASIEEADRWRLEGERLVLDRTAPDWNRRAVEKLRLARDKYLKEQQAAENAPLAIRERNRVLLQAPDYLRWAQLCGAYDELDEIANIFSALKTLETVLASSGSKDFKALKDLRDAVSEFHTKVSESKSPWRIADYLATVLPNPTERADLSAKMLSAERSRGYSFSDGSSDVKPYSPSKEKLDNLTQLFAEVTPPGEIESKVQVTSWDDAKWREVLEWNSDRYHRALADAPEKEVDFLRGAANSYRALANRLNASDPANLQTIPDPSLTFGDVPREIPLETADQEVLKVAVNSIDATPVWLVAQYDGELLDVVSESAAVIKQIELQQDAPAAEYPIRPSALKEPPAAEPLSNGTAVFNLTIKRRSSAKTAGVARLILKAVSSDAENKDYVRREINVNLPGGGMVDIAVADQPTEIWNQNEHALHPLPNKVQGYVFNVLNPAKVAQKVEVSFWVPARLPAVPLPAGPQKQEAAKRILNDFGNLQPFGRAITVELPASGEAVRLNDPTLPPATNLLAIPKDADGITLRRGLIVKLKSLEKDVDAVTLRHIKILPLRPSSYLTATAHCDRMRRFQIDVKCTNSSIIQDQVLQLKAHSKNFLQSLPSELNADLAGENTVSMYGYLESGKENITVDVDVDDYPRVFKFVLTSVAEGDYQPRNEPAVEVSVPLPNGPPYAFKAPVTDLPVIVKIDGPPEDFGDGGSVVLVSFDQGAKRTPEGDGDSVQTLRADRAVKIVAKSFSPDGTLSIEGRVGDFHLHLSPKISNQTEPLDLMGWIMTGEQIRAYSDPPVSVLFDGAPPAIDVAFPGIQAKDQRARIIEFGDELVIHVVPRGRDLSGIAKVEATFEKPIVQGANPEPWATGVEQTAPDGRTIWVVKLKIDDNVGTGEKWIRVKATDRVTNESFPLRERINIVPKVAPPKPVAAGNKPPLPATNDVPIQVFWGTEPVPAKVNLEPAAGVPTPKAETGKDGRYTFTKVPPGTYVLTVLTTESRQNRYRRGQQTITVPKPPEKVAVIKVGVR